MTSPLRWTHEGRLFSLVTCDGQVDGAGLLQAECRLRSEAQTIGMDARQPSGTQGPLHFELQHCLRESGFGRGEDLLEGALTLHNRSEVPQYVEAGFVTRFRPSPTLERQRAYLPLNVAGIAKDSRFDDLGGADLLGDCDQPVGSGQFQTHYLEPGASYPDQSKTRALLLAPVVDIFHPDETLRVAIFSPSLEPRRFSADSPNGGERRWTASRWVMIPARGTITERCWLFFHEGDASLAWKTFLRFAHHEEHAPIDWAQKFKVHYYDFLSSAGGENAHRGDGYDADLLFFHDFQVGMATQHGFYPAIGDYIHPDRKTWLAMCGDQHGPAEMSLDLMRDRIRATREAGAKAAIYIHSALLDDAAPFFPTMRDCIQLDGSGEMMGFNWAGPDIKGKAWRASLNSLEWRQHLLQQVQWIMEILQPDAIVVDETFSGLGYDHHPAHAGPISSSAIEFYRKLRALVRAFGNDKAVFTSDCSMSGFVMWADGDVGDHAYPGLLGNPLYRQSPVRYLASLGDKPWRPCAWHSQKMWDLQMEFARQVGAGVGVSNGWLEYSGLAGMDSGKRDSMLADIGSLWSPDVIH